MSDGMPDIFRAIRDYFAHLSGQRGLKDSTVKCYKGIWGQFLRYVSAELGLPLEKLCFSLVTREVVESYLDWLEQEGGCCERTRNHHLSAVRSLFKFAAGKDPSMMFAYQQLAAIPKKQPKENREVEYFSESALETILLQPDLAKASGRRNRMMLVMLYDTALRVQELLNLKIGDLILTGTAPYVVVTGKGGKVRFVPVMDETVAQLRSYILAFHGEGPTDDAPLFYVARGGKQAKMSTDNVEKFVRKYGVSGHAVNPEVPENLYPHEFRHSRAVHLYRGGMPMPLLSEWLGHSQMSTTLKYYANANTAMKREAIEKATSALNPLLDQGARGYDYANDDELVMRLCGLK